MAEIDFINSLISNNKNARFNFPDKELAEKFADDLFNFFFRAYEGKFESAVTLHQELLKKKNMLSVLLFDLIKDEEKVKQHTDEFFNAISEIYSALLKDADAVVKFDPAAESIEEVLVAYPGFYAIAIYRMAHQLHQQKIKILPRIMSEFAHSKTGIDIHPGATIGESFFIDHGTGIVIGETAVIGNNVKLYQGVTLGALHVTKENAKIKRHPTIEDEVIIYSGATILGGNTVIGKNSIIGGNVWLTYSVPSHSIVYHKSEIKVRDNNPLPDVLNFVI